MPARRVTRTLRSVLFWLHLSTAVALGLVIMFMAATGVALAYQRPIAAFMAARHRVAPPANAVLAQRLPLDSLAAAAARAIDAAAVDTLAVTVASVTVNADATLPVTVGMSDRRSLFVDPYTGRVLGSDAGVRGLFQSIERWHRSIAIGTGMRSKAGTAVSGVANLAFMFLILSGVMIWWPRRWSRHAFAAILFFRRGVRGRKREWNWHHVLGFWAAPVLLVIVVSGAFMSYSWPQRLVARMAGVQTTIGGGRAGGRASGAATAASTQRGEGRGGRAPELEGAGGRRERARREIRERAPLDSLLARAQAAGPWTTIQVRLPQTGAQTATVSVTSGTTNRPDRRTQFTLDASTGAVLQRQGYADYGPARKARVWARPLHTGEVGGLLGETIAALASAAAVLLGITGLSLAFRRALAFARRPATSRRSAARPVPATERSLPT